jgi:RNA polymerase sigma factor (sigma-70 family)
MNGETPEDSTQWHQTLLRRFRYKVARADIACDHREDLVQQAMKAVLENVACARPRNKEAWALTIMDHLIIDYWRGQGRVAIEPLDQDALDRHSASGLSPEEALLEAERRDILAEAVACLKEPNKTYFTLLIEEELTNQEVTEQLGVSAATVRKQAWRMMTKLAELVSEIQMAKSKNRSIRL